MTVRIPFPYLLHAALLLAFACTGVAHAYGDKHAAPAAHDPWDVDEEHDSTVDFSFIIGDFRTGFETADSEGETYVGGAVAFGTRVADGVSFAPRFEAAMLRDLDPEQTVLGILPLDFVIEFAGVANPDTDFGFSLFLEIAAGVEFFFFEHPALTNDDNITFVYLPIEAAAGCRLYLDQLYLFGKATGGYHASLWSSDENGLQPEEIWRFGLAAGVGFQF